MDQNLPEQPFFFSNMHCPRDFHSKSNPISESSKKDLYNNIDFITNGLSYPLRVEKGWGYELHIINGLEYCLKKLVFNKKNAKFSMHFHKDKKETWYVEKGRFKINFIHTKDAKKDSIEIEEGDVWTNVQLFPHQLICLTDEAIITEVSTYDKREDNYRVEPGDSQNG